MSEVVRRAGIYGARDYQKIVEELLEFWEVGQRSGLSAAGAAAQDKLMKIPARLQRMGDYLEAKASHRTFTFDFLYDRPVVL
jgi:acyl-[acyl-carrier-protein] desaturase